MQSICSQAGCRPADRNSPGGMTDETCAWPDLNCCRSNLYLRHHDQPQLAEPADRGRDPDGNRRSRAVPAAEGAGLAARRCLPGPVISEVDETLPPYISLNPGATADDREQPGIPVERTVIVPTTSADDLMAQGRNHADGSEPPAAEVVDEYFQE